MIKKNKKGFTLVELLVVIAIIGILAAVGVTALSGARAKARDAKRVADIKQIQSALELYYTDNQAYPLGDGTDNFLALGDLTDCTTACDTISSVGIAATATPPTYMGLIPKDPSATTTECDATPDAPCHYSYQSFQSDGSACDTSGDVCTSYKIWAWLEGAAGGLSAGAVCANQSGVANTTCP